jgi:hypothetical protein
MEEKDFGANRVVDSLVRGDVIWAVPNIIDVRVVTRQPNYRVGDTAILSLMLCMANTQYWMAREGCFQMFCWRSRITPIYAPSTTTIKTSVGLADAVQTTRH